MRGRDSSASNEVESPRLCPDLVLFLVHQKKATSAYSQGDQRVIVRASPPGNQSVWAPHSSIASQTCETLFVGGCILL